MTPERCPAACAAVLARGVLIRAVLALAVTAAAGAADRAARAADRIDVAVNRLSAGAPLFIAKELGFFANQGLDVTLNHLTSSQAIGLAVASGDVSFGMTAITAGIYTMAGKGGVKMIAAGYEERPGFRGAAMVVNWAAYEQGFTSLSNLPGKRVGITAIGSASHNQLARLAAKYQFNVGDMQLVPLQTLDNEMSAVSGGQVDATMLPATSAMSLEANRAARIIAWMGDEVPTQIGGVFATPDTIGRRLSVSVRFIAAYTQATAYYDRAFQRRIRVGTEIRQLRGDNYDEALRIIAMYTGERPAALAMGLPFFDPEASLKLDNIAQQIAVYQALGVVDPMLTTDMVVARSFVPTGQFPLQ